VPRRNAVAGAHLVRAKYLQPGHSTTYVEHPHPFGGKRNQITITTHDLAGAGLTSGQRRDHVVRLETLGAAERHA